VRRSQSLEERQAAIGYTAHVLGSNEAFLIAA
jgi:hypothetical protein